MIETSRQAEICQEARFVLWALRCAVAAGRGAEEAAAELTLGFELADVAETAAAFRGFAAELCAVQWPLEVWHHPRCCCISTQEMFILQALAQAAERHRQADSAHGHWWRLLLPANHIAAVDAAAREWLGVLERAGVVFPSPAELVECLRPLEGLTEPAPLWVQRPAMIH